MKQTSEKQSNEERETPARFLCFPARSWCYPTRSTSLSPDLNVSGEKETKPVRSQQDKMLFGEIYKFSGEKERKPVRKRRNQREWMNEEVRGVVDEREWNNERLESWDEAREWVNE